MLRVDQLAPTHGTTGLSPETQPLREQSRVSSESALTLALEAMDEFGNEALAETEENLGFALGARRGDARRSSSTQDSSRGRVLAEKLVAELATVDPVEAATLDDTLKEANSWLHSPQILSALRTVNPDPGKMALALAAQLAYGKPSPRLRSRLEQALAELSADDGMALSLFGALEFRTSTPALRQELRRLYHRSSGMRQKLSQWMDELGEREGRAAKLKTMIRVLAYELSASGQPIMGNHLASVIGDLKQLLRVLGLEAHCDQAALALQPEVDGEQLLQAVISLVEQLWIDASVVSEQLPPVENATKYRLLNVMVQLVQLLPENCFVDMDQKEQLVTAITELRDRVLDQAS